jgi:hypothetical protein
MWLRWRRLSLLEELSRLEMRFKRREERLWRITEELRALKGLTRVVPFRRG